MFARLSALFLLGLALLKTLIARWTRPNPLVRFSEHYGSEGILPVARSDARVLAEVHRCTACGRCDENEGERIAASGGRYRGMMAFALAGTRSLPDFDATKAALEGIDESAFEAAEARCPEGVPLLELARLVRRTEVAQRSGA